MKNNDQSLNELFAIARQETPRASLGEVEASFHAGLALAGGATVSVWSKLLNLKTGIIMIGIGVISTMLLMNMQGGPEASDLTTVVEQSVTAEIAGEKDTQDRAQLTMALHKSTPPELRQELAGLEDGKAQALPTIHANPAEPKPAPMKEEAQLPLVEKKRDNEGVMLPEDSIEEIEVRQDTLETVDDDLREIRYVINSSTTEADLQNMMREAEKAGIRMSYTAKIKRNMVRKLHMHLAITKEGEKVQRRINVYSSKGSNFTTNVVWRLDSDGNAVDFAGEGRSVSTLKTSCAN